MTETGPQGGDVGERAVAIPAGVEMGIDGVVLGLRQRLGGVVPEIRAHGFAVEVFHYVTSALHYFPHHITSRITRSPLTLKFHSCLPPTQCREPFRENRLG